MSSVWQTQTTQGGGKMVLSGLLPGIPPSAVIWIIIAAKTGSRDPVFIFFNQKVYRIVIYKKAEYGKI